MVRFVDIYHVFKYAVQLFTVIHLKYAIFFLDVTQFQIDPQALKLKKNMFGKPEVISFPSSIHV